MTVRTPKNLTAMPKALLDASRPEAPVSTAFDDIYFSFDNGLAETHNVFLKACGLPERFEGRDMFTVAELGFGSGLNFLALWKMWKTHRPSPNARLHFVSVEGYPLSREQLTEALAQWGELEDEANALIAAWPSRTPGQHIIDFEESGVRLMLCHDQVLPALNNLTLSADCWFLDGFTPSKNPDMWSEAVMQRVYDLSAGGCKVGTFTVAGSVRRALAAAGFEVSKQPGFGRKRERLEAIKPQAPSKPISVGSHTTEPPIIIGAGIAGASLARSFLMRAVTPIIIDSPNNDAASANPVAIVKPRLDLQDRPESRFFLAAYLYAQAVYSGDGLLRRGAAHMAKSEAEQIRFEKLVQCAALPPEHLDYLSPEALTRKTGLAHDYAGLWFDRAPIIDPVKICARFTNGAETISATVKTLRRNDDHWQVIGQDGEVIAQSRHVYLTAGAGTAALYPQLSDTVRYKRGQITLAKEEGNSDSGSFLAPLTYGGYAVPHGEQIILGATHTPRNAPAPNAVTEHEDQANIDAFIAAGGFPVTAQGARASVRVTTANTLPKLMSPEPGLTVITGLGGRGFAFAPLLAEQAVCAHIKAPHPVTTNAALRLSR